MKTSKLIWTAAGFAILAAGCKENEYSYEDSPYIEVISPARNQAVEDKDTVVVKAIIKPPHGSVLNYHIILLDNEKRSIYNQPTECDCKDQSSVEIEAKFAYNIEETSNLVLQVHAEIENGLFIREEIPFRFVDSKK